MTDRYRINFSWILKLRWAAVVGQTLTVIVVEFGLGVPAPRLPVAAILLTEILSNLALEIWFRSRNEDDWAAHGRQLLENRLTAVMTADVLLLGGLLYFTGGPLNPFSVFSLINVALAAVVLPPKNAWFVTVSSLACYTLLFLFNVPLAPYQELSKTYHFSFSPKQGPPREVKLLLAGLWFSFCGAHCFITYFITRVTGELLRREVELSAAQRKRLDAQRVEALATLSAGAAHELATPLGTIAIASKELERSLEKQGASQSLLDDARLIRMEAGRCRGILDLMAVDAANDNRGVEAVAAGALVDTALAGLVESRRIELSKERAATDAPVMVPIHAASQALRAVLQNAIDASPADRQVTCRLVTAGDYIEIIVRDQGEGMSAEVLARAAEPFFTTKDQGKGMGMGLFLARRVIEGQGGELRMESKLGEGSTVTISLPNQRAVV